MASAVAVKLDRPNPLQRLAWRHPEWPWALLTASAWLLLILHETLPEMLTSGAGTEGHMHVSGSHPASAHGHSHDLGAAGLAWWMTMSAAMMIPAALPILREISIQSLWQRRYRGSGLFLSGYLLVWGVFGVLVLSLWTGFGGYSHSVAPLLVGAALLVAAAWGLTPSKARHLKRCHCYRPIPPRGRLADVSALRYGLYNGRQCLGVCWPVMVAMIPGQTLLPMLGVTALVTWERLARLPQLRFTALILAAAGLVTVVAGH